MVPGTRNIHARCKRDGVWEAWVRFMLQRDGYPRTRSGCFDYDDLEPV